MKQKLKELIVKILANSNKARSKLKTIRSYKFKNIVTLLAQLILTLKNLMIQKT